MCALLNGLLDTYIAPLLATDLTAAALANVESYTNPAIVRASKWLQLISQLFIFFIPACLFAYLAFPSMGDYLKTAPPKNKTHWLYAILLMLATIPFLGFLEHINKLIPLTETLLDVEETAKVMTEAFLNDSAGLGGLLNILIFVLLAAAGEELFFRGVLQNIITSHGLKKEPLLGIAIVALAFSLFHGQMHGLIPRFYAGFVIGCAYYYSGSLWVAILMQALNNGISIAAYYAEKNGLFAEGDLNQMYLSVFGIVSAFLLYRLFKTKTNYEIQKVPQDPDDTNLLANKN
jgi:uncharacterized protein